MAGLSTSTPKRTTNGSAWLMLSSISLTSVESSAHRGRKVSNSAMKMPRLRPPTSASGKLTRRPTAAAAIGDHDEVEEVLGRERVERRRDQHARQPGEQARQRPAEGRYPVGEDPVQLGHPRALHHRSHAEADRRVPEEEPEDGHSGDGHDHGHQLVAAEAVDAEGVVEDGRAIGNDPGRGAAGHRLEVDDDVEQRGEREVSPRATTSLATDEAVRRWLKIKRSSSRPTSGASTKTDRTNAGRMSQPHVSRAWKNMAAEM